MIKTNQEAAAYLRNIADHAQIDNYARALELAIKALERVDSLEAELADEKYRHDRYADFTVAQGKIIDQLKQDLRDSGRKDLCSFCHHMHQPMPCNGEDYTCDECDHEKCVCHTCRGYDKWEWRGLPAAPKEG